MKKILLFLFSLFLFNFVNATCPYGEVLDQYQTVADGPFWLYSYLSGTGIFQRSIMAAAQSFVPSITSELPKVEVYGLHGNTYDTSYALGCISASGVFFTLGGASGTKKLAQRFYIDSFDSNKNFATIQVRLAKYTGTSFDNIKISIQSDSGGIPSGISLVEQYFQASDIWNVYPSLNTYMTMWLYPPSGLSSGYYWFVIETIDNINSGIYAVQGSSSNCGSVPAKYYDTTWHDITGGIYFQLNPTTPSSTTACIRIYTDSSNNPGTFLKSALVDFPSSNGWTTFIRWNSDLYCSISSSTGPTLNAGTKYWLSVVPLFNADEQLYWSFAAPYPNGEFKYSWYSNPTWKSSGYDLAFRTYICNPGAPPSITAPMPTTATVNVPQSYYTTVSKGDNDLACLGWRWGDGTPDLVYAIILPTTYTETHTYTSTGSKTLTVKTCDSTHTLSDCANVNTSQIGCAIASSVITVNPTSTPSPTVTPSPSPSPTTSPSPSPSPSIPPSGCVPGSCMQNCYQGDPCTQSCDCHVGNYCNPKTNKCDKLGNKVKTFGFDMFGLSISLLEFGIITAIVVALLLLLMGRREDI